MTPLMAAIVTKSLPIVEIYLKVGNPNIQLVNANGRSSLWIATELGSLPIMKLLISLQGKIDTKDEVKAYVCRVACLTLRKVL
jgi:ankyrin repeat protein